MIILYGLLAAALIGGMLVWFKRQRRSTRRSWRERFSSLQWRMTFSYVWITIASVLIIIFLVDSSSFMLVPIAILVGLIVGFKNRREWRERFRDLRWRSISTSIYIWIAIISLIMFLALFNSANKLFSQISFLGRPASSINNMSMVDQVAHLYANNVAQQAREQALGTTFPYPLGQPLTFNPDTYADTDAGSFLRSGEVPYLPERYPANQPVTFALLIAPDQRILSSSYPARYPAGEQANALVPRQSQWIAQALRGHALNGAFDDANGAMIYATASVLDKHAQAVGAIYIQVPLATLQTMGLDRLPSLWSSFIFSLLIVLGLLIVLAPFGGIFGYISTRSLVRHLKMLASATTLVADGDYQQRLPVTSKDEVGQLELQFNRMAEQLGESMTRQKVLAEENARLAERSRISRELHDAISQDLFSLSLLAGGLQSALPANSPLQRQAGMLEQTTNDTIREMRALLLELRPIRLEQLGLAEALAELAIAYSMRLGIRVDTNLIGIQLEARREHALLRVAQEALANAARHASATEITITLALEGKTACLRLRDNGRGFQTDAEGLRHGLGLHMMQERIQELRGIFKVESVPDQGTTLEILLPLEEEL